uniref:Calponin-homology (CH) domain-containing protein n=1 Tax=Globodera pallida TaxID=36090 RepID=A0A183CFL9_GLOPA
MTERATKSGLAAEAQQKIHMTGEPLPVNGEVNEFLSVLHDGTVLCKLANALAPNSVKKINNSELFQTVDLFEGQDPNSVLICLAALARKSEKAFGKPGLGPKEAEGAKKEWTSEQLRADDHGQHASHVKRMERVRANGGERFCLPIVSFCDDDLYQNGYFLF